MSSDHPNADTVRRVYRSFADGDLDLLREALHPEVVLHVPGRNPLSGRYRGREGFFEFLGRLAQLSGGSFRTELEAVLADDRYAVVLGRASARRRDRSHEGWGGAVFALEDGRVTEGWLFHDDQEAVDRFWSG